MSIRVAINGFGRIGRLVLRAIIENKQKDIKVIAINDLAPVETNIHLFKYDSIHGHVSNDIKAVNDSIKIDENKIKVFSENNPENLPWKNLNIDLVLECSGRFTTKDKANKHIKAGAKKVLVSAPTKNADITICYGINDHKLNKKHEIISNASCTTNCLAPIAYIVNKSFGIEHGYMTTVHAFTGDQNLMDSLHSDLNRARAASLSMILTSTGAAKSVGSVLPELKGKLDGSAIRVPVPNVSLVDFTFTTKKNTTVGKINEEIINASQNELKNILDINRIPLVSIDFNHNAFSSVFDLTQTQVIKEKFCRVLAWYDNEWGFSNRMIDTTLAIGKLL